MPSPDSRTPSEIEPELEARHDSSAHSDATDGSAREGTAVTPTATGDSTPLVSSAPIAGDPAPSSSSAPTAGRSPDEGPAFGPSGELPQRYGTDRLALLIRDPRWCFAWWELTPATHAAAGVPAATLVLRFCDVTDVAWDGHNHRATIEMSVGGGLGSRYVELGRPGSSFVAELGLRAPDGRTVWVVRSNRVDMPRAGPSPEVDPQWPPLPGASARLTMSEDDLRPSPSSAAWPTSPAPRPGPSRDPIT